MPDSDHKQALPPGHQLGHYRLLDVLGVGGFGVTYLGEHVSLGHRVAVKEYLPNEFAVREGATVHPKSPADREDFEWGLTRFVDEARTLTRFRHPNLVRVSDYFEANNTAYIVMDYEDGEPLDALLQRHGTLTEAQLKRVLLPVADGLRQVHAAGFLHRDIKPSNIFVRRSDETPVLLDFGAARQALGRKSKSMTAIASAGYSPPEQYESQGAQGAWTDVYALAALCHRAVTGKAPMEAPRRQGQLLRSQVDPLPRLAETGAPDYSQAFLEAVDWGLRVIETERPQSLDEWLAQMEDAEAEPAEKPKTSTRSKRKEAVGPTPPQPTAISAGRRTGRSTPPETAARPAAQEGVGFGAKAAWLGGAAASIGVALYFALAYWPQGSGQPQPFTVAATPSNASVEILGAAEAYRAGVPLAPGDYRVRVSAPRYEAQEESVRHGMGPTRHAVALAKVRQPFTVEASPATAQVRLVDRSEGYRAGMLLSWGEHRVEVSATGYQSKTETVRHGSSGPTVHRVELEKLFEVGGRFRDCPDCPEMVVVPSGSFRMGSPSHEEGRYENEGPVHQVRIGKPFAVGVYEVTVSEFGRFADGTGHSTGNSCLTVEGGELEDRVGRGWRDPGFRQAGSHPVVCVSWDDARAYASWLSRSTGERYRLLSESEWEYVARAGTTGPFHTGSTISTDQANYNGGYVYGSGREGVYRERTVPVGSFGSNAFGLHDVHGNVWEWTGDCWNESYAGAPSDGSSWERGDCSLRVLRGGAWDYVPRALRSAFRGSNDTGNHSDNDGFRVARTLAP